MSNTPTEPRFSVAAAGGRTRVLFQGHEVADSAQALVLSETGHPPVCYFPREDVQMSVLRTNDHVTTCPHKGVATWFTITRDARLVENVAWSYEAPIEAASIIAGHIAFDVAHVDIQHDAAEPPRHVPAHDPPYV